MNLSQIGVTSCCEAVRICYPIDAEEFAVSVLRKFALHRPIGGAQALSRPLPW